MSDRIRALSYRWLTIGLGAFIALYAWYVVEQYGSLNKLNQRELAAAGAELRRTFENAVGTVNQFDPPAGSANPVCEFDIDQPYLDVEDCKKAPNEGFSGVKISTTDGLSIEATPKNQSKQPKTVRFRFRTDTLLQELPFSESFRIVFLADQEGSILYQEAPAERRWLHFLRWGEREFRDSFAGDSSGLQIQNISEALGPDAKSAWKQLRSASTSTSIHFGGGWQQLYLEPVVLHDGNQIHLVLGSVVPVQDLIRQALALGTYFLAALSFLLLLGILGYPFVKLISLDPHERFRLRDVYLLYLSTGALLSLFTFLMLGWDGSARWHETADFGLRKMADDLGDKLTEELIAVRDQLVAYDHEISMLPTRNCRDWQIDRDWFNEKKHLLKLPASPIFLEQVAWVGPDGKQVWKITSDKVAEKVQVGTRTYFRAVRDHNLFRIAGQGKSFFLGPDRSITDGKFYTFVSMRSELNPCFCKDVSKDLRDGEFVAVATVNLLSVDRPALPAGYGFAIVNREGRVLYHSDNRLSLRENLFAELQQGDRAKAIMFAGDEESIFSRYRERQHEFFFHPLMISVSEDTNNLLYLAAFRDMSMEQAAIAHAFVISLTGPMLLLLAFMAVALWAMTRISRQKDQRKGVWLWPHGGLVGLYRHLTVAYAGVFLLGLILHLNGHGTVGFLVLPLAAVCVLTIYGSRNWQAQPRRSLESPVWHAAQLILLLVCVVIAPSAALFRLVLAHEFGKMIDTERAWVMDQRDDGKLALQAGIRGNGYPTRIGDLVAERRDLYYVTPPAPYNETDTPLVDQASRTILEAHEWQDHVLPIENDTVARQRFQKLLHLYSPPGLLGDRWCVSVVALVGFTAILVLLAFWIRWNATQIFLSDVASPANEVCESAEVLWEACTPDERMLLLQVTREQIANPGQKPLVAHLVNRGLLRFAPELCPSSEALKTFLLRKEKELQGDLLQWEQVKVRRSWRQVRPLLWVALGGLGLFLVATQPSLQSDVLSLAAGVTGALTTLVKFREAITGWFAKPKATN